jgi:hypothetical protein
MKMSFDEAIKSGLLDQAFKDGIAKAAAKRRAHNLPPAGPKKQPKRAASERAIAAHSR